MDPRTTADMMIRPDWPLPIPGAKQTVQALVNRHVLADAVVVCVVFRDFPARIGFDQRQAIWCITVHLVGRRKDKNGTRAIFSRRFQQDQRAVGIDGKVG